MTEPLLEARNIYKRFGGVAFGGLGQVSDKVENVVSSPIRYNFGAGLPSSCVSRGLGSNVSTCEGPPGMKRKMTRLAEAGKCGRLADSGSGGSPAFCSAADVDSSASSAASASAPNPPPERRSKSRRVSRFAWRAPGVSRLVGPCVRKQSLASVPFATEIRFWTRVALNDRSRLLGRITLSGG